MDASETRAPWYLEENGSKTGPYTSKQIMELVMDGKLKFENQIFDSLSEEWSKVEDIIPRLSFSGNGDEPPSPPSSSNWRAPPRPIEFKNVHVVELNSKATGNIDYLSLLAEKRRAGSEKAAASSQRSAASTTPGLRTME